MSKKHKILAALLVLIMLLTGFVVYTIRRLDVAARDHQERVNRVSIRSYAALALSNIAMHNRSEVKGRWLLLAELLERGGVDVNYVENADSYEVMIAEDEKDMSIRKIGVTY